jgi:hypothetical protein
MTFAEYVNKEHPNAPLTPWQWKMIHDISEGRASIFNFGKSMGKKTVFSLWQEFCERDVSKEDVVSPDKSNK